MNAIPLVTVRPIECPKWDNTNIDNEGLWTLDNAIALARYWQQLGRALGLDDHEGEEDLGMWIANQHTQEWGRVEMAKRAAAAIASIGQQPARMYQPPKLSEEEVIALHRQEQARRLK